MSAFFSAVVLMLSGQAYDPRPDIANLYAAFGMEVGPEALTLLSPAEMTSMRVFSGPQINGKSTRSSYGEATFTKVSTVQVGNIGAKPDIPGQQALPWASRAEAVALANTTLGLIQLSHPTQVRIVHRGDGQDFGLSTPMGFGLRAVFDYKLEGYPFLEPLVGVELLFDRNGVLRIASKAVKFPDRAPLADSMLTLEQAKTSARQMLPYSTPVRSALGWISRKGEVARLTYRLVQDRPAGSPLGVVVIDVDAISGSARNIGGLNRASSLEALMP